MTVPNNFPFFQECPSPSFFFDLHNLRITEVNRAALSLYGYNREEMLSLTIKDLRKKEDVPKLMRFLREEFDSQTSPGIWKHLTKDKKPIDVNILYKILNVDNGKQVYVTVNEIKKELDRREQLLQTVIDQTGSIIYIKDETGSFRFVNRHFLDLFNLETEQVIGRKNVDFMQDDEAEKIFLNDESVRKSGGPIQFEEQVNINGELRTFLSTKILLQGIERYENCVFGISNDITKRKKTEDKLREALKEKVILLKEIHHRVKNNLAVISGLMELQAMESASKEYQNKIRDNQARIRSMALIHELLYQEKNFSKVNFGENIKKLTETISETFNASVTFIYDLQPVTLNINQALPCTLMLNEIITNAFKHAFKNTNSPVIGIKMCEIDKKVILSIRDNGSGLPSNFNITSNKSLGIELIRILKKQLDAELNIRSDSGTEFEIIFEKSNGNGFSNHTLNEII